MLVRFGSPGTSTHPVRQSNCAIVLLRRRNKDTREENLGFSRVVKQEESGSVYASVCQLVSREPKVRRVAVRLGLSFEGQKGY